MKCGLLLLWVKNVRYYVWTIFGMDTFPESKVHGANMGPIWGRQDPDGPHIVPMNFAIWVKYGS